MQFRSRFRRLAGVLAPVAASLTLILIGAWAETPSPFTETSPLSTRQYLEKLSRLAPDEREKFKTTVEKFTRPVPLTDGDRATLVAETTSPTREDQFVARLKALCTLARPIEERRVIDFCVLEYLVNPVAASRRLDRAIRDAVARKPLTLETLQEPLDADHAVAGPLPATVTHEEGERAFAEGQLLYDEARVQLDRADPRHRATFAHVVRLMATAARGGYLRARALFYLGSALLFRSTQNEIEKARDVLQKSLDLERDRYTLFHLAIAHGLTGRLDRRIALLEQALKIEPRWADAHFHAAAAYDAVPAPESGRPMMEHLRAALGSNSAYRRRIRNYIRVSQKAARSAAFLSEIMSALERAPLTEEQIPGYEKRVAKEPTLFIVPLGLALLAEAVAEMFRNLDGVTMTGLVVLGAAASVVTAVLGGGAPAPDPSPSPRGPVDRVKPVRRSS